MNPLPAAASTAQYPKIASEPAAVLILTAGSLPGSPVPALVTLTMNYSASVAALAANQGRAAAVYYWDNATATWTNSGRAAQTRGFTSVQTSYDEFPYGSADVAVYMQV